MSLKWTFQPKMGDFLCLFQDSFLRISCRSLARHDYQISCYEVKLTHWPAFSKKFLMTLSLSWVQFVQSVVVNYVIKKWVMVNTTNQALWYITILGWLTTASSRIYFSKWPSSPQYGYLFGLWVACYAYKMATYCTLFPSGFGCWRAWMHMC